jgi:hypothetical protein
MANPLTKVPKWAWIASGGVVVGVGAFRFLRKGSVVDTSTTATAPGDQGLTDQTMSPGFVDVPFSSSGAAQVTQAPADYAGLIDSVGGLIAAVSPPRDTLSDILGSLTPILTGGGAPVSTATFAPPAPVAAAPPPPAPAPAPVPVPAAPAANPCPAKYPFQSNRGCYQVYCAPKGGARAAGRWHLYASAPDQFIHGLPC